MSYNDQNIFAKILRGDIPSTKLFEDDHVLVIEDAFPQASVHVLILPKGQYVSMTDFTAHAGDAEMVAMMRAVSKVVEIKNLSENGYRLIANAGDHGGQEVPHLHWHIVGGEKLGRMLSK